MSAGRNALLVAAALAVILAAVCFAPRDPGKSGAPEASGRGEERTAAKTSGSAATRPQTAAKRVAEATRPRELRGKKKETALKTDRESFEALLAEVAKPLRPKDKKGGIDPDVLAEKRKAADALLALSTGEKIHWLGEMSADADAATRKAAMAGTRMFFSEKAYERGAGLSTLADWRREGAAEKIAALGSAARPDAEETAAIGEIVCAGLSDEDAAVWREALDAAAAFDTSACNDFYAYAMASGCDALRLAVLDNAKSGDPGFLLMLEFAALDAGGPEVAAKAAAGIKEAVGMEFKNSQEAFAWYEKNGEGGIPRE